MRYASVCDGIGAAHVAWQPLGWQCAWTSEIEPFPSAVVEQRFGYENIGDMTQITEEMLNERGPVDLLVGGTPCQSFSVAGLRGGLADPRGNLALRFVQLAAVMQPKWIVWENVPGVLSSGKGRDFGTFLGALGELGYGFAYRVLDAQWFGVAQRRRRVFVVGHARDWRRAAAVLFERESVFGNPPTRGETWQGTAACSQSGSDTVGTLCADHHPGAYSGQDAYTGRLVAFHPTQDPISSEDGSTHAIGCGPRQGCATAAVAIQDVSGREKRQNGKGYNADGTAYTVDAAATQGVAVSIDLQNVTAGGDLAGTLDTTRPSRGGGQAIAWDILGTLATNAAKQTDVHTALRGRTPGQSEASTTTVVAFAQTQREEVAFANRTRDGVKLPEVMPGGVAPALTNPGGGERSDAVNVAIPMAVRRLTPRECERLQGFQDDWTLVTYRNKPAADGPRYRALGNSMAVPVMRWIGERIRMVEALA